MANRRELLQMGLAVAALPLGSTQVLAAANNRARFGESVVPYKVLYDTRFPAGVAFGQRAGAQGLPLAAFEGDVTRIWYDDLYHRWKEGPATIAGLTGYGALFCLEQLAWDRRMRVVFRAAHALPVDGCSLHTIDGPTEVLGSAQRAVGQADWGAAMADLVVRCPAAPASRATVVARSDVIGPWSPAGEPLFTWVIAPVARG